MSSATWMAALGYGGHREPIHTPPPTNAVSICVSPPPRRFLPLRRQQTVGSEHPSWTQSLLFPDTFCLPPAPTKPSLPVLKGVSHLVCFFCCCFLKPLPVQSGPNWTKARRSPFLRGRFQRPPRGSWGCPPTSELLNCRKKEAFVTGTAAVGSETEADCARKQTTGKKKVQPQNSLGLQSSASCLFLKDKFPFFGVIPSDGASGFSFKRGLEAAPAQLPPA